MIVRYQPMHHDYVSLLNHKYPSVALKASTALPPPAHARLAQQDRNVSTAATTSLPWTVTPVVTAPPRRPPVPVALLVSYIGRNHE